MAELLKLLGDNPTDERLALVTKLMQEERQLLLLRQQQEQQQQQAAAQPASVTGTGIAGVNNPSSNGYDPLLGPLTEQIGGLAFTSTGSNFSGLTWDGRGMNMESVTSPPGWADLANQNGSHGNAGLEPAAASYGGMTSDMTGVSVTTPDFLSPAQSLSGVRTTPDYFSPAPPSMFTGFADFADPTNASRMAYQMPSDIYAADQTTAQPAAAPFPYEDDFLGDLSFLNTLLQPDPTAFAGFGDYVGTSAPDLNPFVFYGTPAPQPVFGDDGLFHCAATLREDIAEPAPRFFASSSSASSSAGSSASMTPSPDINRPSIILSPPYTRQQQAQPQSQPVATATAATRQRRRRAPASASTSTSTATPAAVPAPASRLRPTKRIIPTLNLACRTCATPLGRAYLYTDTASAERTVADTACRTCAQWDDGRRIHRSGGATSSANADARDAGWACDVCKRVGAVGGVREGDASSSSSLSLSSSWKGVGFAVEFNCAGCMGKYALCSDCGAGGKFRSGKWRPSQLFMPGRATCSLSHTRLTKTPKETFVFALAPAVTTNTSPDPAVDARSNHHADVKDVDSYYAALPHDPKAPPTWALSQALAHCTFDVLARALAVPAWMEANTEIETWPGLEKMLSYAAGAGVAEVEGKEGRRVLLCNSTQRVERGRRRYVAMKCVGGKDAWDHAVMPVAGGGGGDGDAGGGAGGEVVLIPPRATSVLVAEWLVERQLVMPMNGSGEIFDLLIDILKRITADYAAAVAVSKSPPTLASASSPSPPPPPPPPPKPLFVQVVTGAYITGADRLTRMGLRAVEQRRGKANADGDASISWVFRAGARASDGPDEERALRGVLEWEDPVARERIKTVYLGRVDEVIDRWTREQEERKGSKNEKGGRGESEDPAAAVSVGKKRTRK
ncbi:hypothetical protein HDU88_002582 [Geranomyces variabilis]|nr:hypothetical protein HDU88_002582 [Geranomyces variabilis]